MTKEEIDEFMGADARRSLRILKKAGLLESQWRVPELGEKPSKEYHTSYSKVQVNFQSSFEDLSDIIMLTFKPYEEVQGVIEELEKQVEEGNTSMSNLTRTLNKNPFYICAVARRSERLSVMGQRLKLIEGNEENYE